MIDEVRAERAEVDWSKVEAALFDERGEVRAPVRAPAGGRPLWVLGGVALAAAAAIAMWVSSRAPSAGTPEVASGKGGPSPSAHVESSTPRLVVGHAVRTGDVATVAEVPSHVRVAVAPRTTLAVLDDGVRVRLRLDDGAVAADVVPVAGGEPYAVDVGERRVAVHGTHLVVARVGDDIVVGVSEGLAVIGAADGSARTEGPEIKAGQVGRFSIHAGSAPDVRSSAPDATRFVEEPLAGRGWPNFRDELSKWPTTTATAIELPVLPAPKPVGPSTSVSTAPPAAAVAAPKGPTDLEGSDYDKVLDTVDTDLRSKCFVLRGGKTSASYSFRYRLRVGDNGRVAEHEKDPIDPAKSACVGKAFDAATFPTGKPGWTKSHEFKTSSSER